MAYYTCNNQTVNFYRQEDGICQDYVKIKNECKKKDILFEDPEFPKQKAWKRPRAIVKDPQFIVDGASRADIRQGQLGDCWLIAGIVCLTRNLELWEFIVPNDQSFKAGEYTGAFHFRFWRHGEWVDVVIDDFLPMHYDPGSSTRKVTKKLNNLCSSTQNEFWGPLLEKAYAKIMGSYEALTGGNPIESMVDLSGGIPETIYMNEPNATLHRLAWDIFTAFLKESWITCSIAKVSSAEDKHFRDDLGLMTKHAYNVTSIRIVRLTGGTWKYLIKIRNSSDKTCEWKGGFSDTSKDWAMLQEADRNQFTLNPQDSEFWMDLADFKKHFFKVDMCHLDHNMFKSLPNKFQGYKVAMFHGSWSEKDGTACGWVGQKPDNYKFHLNPQYRVVIRAHNHCHEGEDFFREGWCLIVSLMQKKCVRDKRKKLHTIGFYVYEIPDETMWPEQKLPEKFFRDRRYIKPGVTFAKIREITERYRVKPGTYVIVPCTEEANHEADFTIRILTEDPIEPKM